MIGGSSNRPARVAASVLPGSQGTSPLGSAQAAPFKPRSWATRTASAQHVALSRDSRWAWFPHIPPLKMTWWGPEDGPERPAAGTLKHSEDNENQ